MSFAFLPAELRIRIVQYALQPQRNGSLSSTSHNNAIDSWQAAALALVSRSCNAIVTRHLYSQICVTHPSSLQQLQSTLAKRPDLAALVRSIHLGPDAELPQLGWPIRMGSQPPDELVELHLMPSLSRPRDDEVLPTWLQVGYQCRLNSAVKTCQGFAIFKAMEAAMRDIDVEPWRQGYGKSEERIGSRAWMARLYLLQAALDLYLMEMRRIEDGRTAEDAEMRPAKRAAGRKNKSQPCKSSKCGHYPSLMVLDTTPAAAASVQPEADDNCLRLTIPQLWQHLDREGGPADHFDSLVLLTRSSRLSLDLGKREWRRVFDRFGGPDSFWVSNAEWQRITGNIDVDDCMSQASAAEEEEEGYEGEDEEDDIAGSESEKSDLGSASSIQDGQEDVALDGPAYKVEDLISLARSILMRTTEASNVSLASYLYRALPALPHPHLLRTVNIGPLPSWWTKEVFPFDFVRPMEGLIKLRVAGRISRLDASRLRRWLPTLEELEWVWVGNTATWNDVIYVVEALQGEAPRKRPRQSLEDSHPNVRARAAEVFAMQGQRTQRHTRVLLSKSAGLETAPSWAVSPSVYEAWRQGQAIPGTLCTVKVCYFEDEAKSSVGVRDEPATAFLGQVYADGRKWWDSGHTGGRV